MTDVPQYVRDIVRLYQDGAIPSGVHRVTVVHDRDCNHWRGRPCSCRPDLVFKPWEEPIQTGSEEPGI